MTYIPSINIELNTADQFQYIVTENSKLVLGNLVNGFNSGHHSFTVIGTYGTGKSSFIVALEHDLKNNSKLLIENPKVFGDVAGFEFLNIVGDYASLSDLLARKLNSDDNTIDALHSYYNSIKKQNKFLFIVVDEFGKILEHAANNNPEKELYFLQKLSEFVNVPSRNIIFLTTLHQNFGSYASKLSEQQRNEWLKVKGRFKEVVFAEPVEQLWFIRDFA
jgi:Cdc6-like AAA superfamily ATPase